MTLLFDENLSPRLVELLAKTLPGCQHVEFALARGASDSAVWEFARIAGLTIVSKDNDFRQIAFLNGPPPKVLWLAVGNAGTSAIARLLDRNAATVTAFLANSDEALLVLQP